MNKRQIAQTIVGLLALALMVFWFFEPGWKSSKILGIISTAMLAASMVISYIAEEKAKKDKESK